MLQKRYESLYDLSHPFKRELNANKKIGNRSHPVQPERVSVRFLRTR